MTPNMIFLQKEHTISTDIVHAIDLWLICHHMGTHVVFNLEHRLYISVPE